MKVQLSLLDEYANTYSFLKELGYSRQFLKKFSITKLQEQRILKQSSISLPLDLLNHLLINPSYRGPEINVLDEEADWICLSKPSHVHCHPLCYSDKNNVLSFLRQKGIYKPLLVNTIHYDRGLLYRLDFETSGVLCLCKKESLYKKIRQNWNQIEKKKRYLAIVQGKLSNSQTFSHLLSTTGKRVKVKVSELSNAHIKVFPLKYNELHDLTLIEVELKEGLRHQIRAQLAFSGLPILGDTLYGAKAEERLFLHSYFYEFTLARGVCFRARDISPSLFGKFFDLNRDLKMLRD